MKLPLVCAALFLASTLVTSEALARPPEGGYFAFGLGYAAASGDRGVPLKEAPGAGGTEYEEVVRTDFGSGLGFDIRFGWLIGPIAPEISMSGHGTFDFKDGAGYPSFSVRFHPLLLADSLAAIPFDTSVFIGAGYVIGGYQPKLQVAGFNADGKGWDGWDLTFGLGVTYDLSARVRIGLDFRCLLPQYSRFMIDWDDDINGHPTETPSTFVFLPTLQIVASF